MIHQGFSAALLALQFGGGVGSMAPFLLQIVAIFGIFYFLIIRPQQAQKKKIGRASCRERVYSSV